MSAAHLELVPDDAPLPAAQLVAKLARHDGIGGRAISCVLLQPQRGRSAEQIVLAIEDCQRRIDAGMPAQQCSFSASPTGEIMDGPWRGVNIFHLPHEIHEQVVGKVGRGFDPETQCGISWITPSNDDAISYGIVVPGYEPTSHTFEARGTVWVNNDLKFTGQMLDNFPAPGGSMFQIHNVIGGKLRALAVQVTTGRHILTCAPLWRGPNNFDTKKFENGEPTTFLFEFVNLIKTRMGIVATLTLEAPDDRGLRPIRWVGRGVNFQLRGNNEASGETAEFKASRPTR